MKTAYYDKINHISNLLDDPYYANLIKLRNIIEIGCDTYFQSLNAPKVDLFMATKGVSSPMGKGSDSTPIPFMLGEEKVFLVDSSQFGMEPLVQKSFDMVYCYLPSFRGEDSDYRHLNQLNHCEAELQGGYEKCMLVAENLIKGKITELIFDLLFRTSGRFDIIPFGYENTLPELAQHQDNLELKEVLDNIKHSPDFILISQDKKRVFLVEVKHRKYHEKEKILKIAETILNNHYDHSWVFVADHDGFYFDPANTIKNNNGEINLLRPEDWGISPEAVQEYLQLLNKYIQS